MMSLHIPNVPPPACHCHNYSGMLLIYCKNQSNLTHVKNETIKIFNYGNCKRDFTYIDDIVSGVQAVMQCAPLPNEDGVKYKIYNIGNNKPVKNVLPLFLL